MSDFLNWELTNRMHNLGYDGKTLMYIDDEGDIINDDSAELIGAKPAILTSAAFRFFREKYGLQHDITLSIDNNNQLIGFYILIHKFNPLWNEDKIVELEITTTDRDEAELACIEKLIELTFKSE